MPLWVLFPPQLLAPCEYPLLSYPVFCFSREPLHLRSVNTVFAPSSTLELKVRSVFAEAVLPTSVSAFCNVSVRCSSSPQCSIPESLVYFPGLWETPAIPIIFLSPLAKSRRSRGLPPFLPFSSAGSIGVIRLPVHPICKFFVPPPLDPSTVPSRSYAKTVLLSLLGEEMRPAS